MGVTVCSLPCTVMALTALLCLSLSSALASPWGSKQETEQEWNKQYDEPTFTVESRGQYERRTYPASTWACTNLTVDTAADPLAGLEGQKFTELMQTQRYKNKVPSSKMFWPLFRYIGGVNEGNVVIEMTKGVTTSHTLLKKDNFGEVEVQEMCFYLENKFQASLGGTEAVPEPTDPKVHIKNRPELTVFAMQFGGYAFTADTWIQARERFINEIQRKDEYVRDLYYTGSKSHPWVPESKRINEVWLQAVV